MFTLSTLPRQKAENTSYHHGNLRAALVEAGLAMLETGTRDELSLRELARQVGVSANAAYRHFENKEALLAAMAAEGMRRLAAEQAQAAAPRATPAEKFLEAGRTYVGFARRHPALFRLMFGRFSATSRSEELAGAGQAAFDAMRRGLAEVMRREPDDAQTVMAAMYSWSLVHGLAQLIVDGQFDQHTQDIDALVTAVLMHAAALAR